MDDASAVSKANGFLQEVLLQILDDVNASLQKVVCQTSHCIGNKLRQKTRDLKSGDIIIPRGCLKLNQEQCDQFLTSFQDTSNPLVLEASSDKHYLLSIHLNRAAVYQRVLQQVQHQGPKYGYSVHRDCGTVFIRQASGSEMAQTVSDLRSNIVAEHVKKLLQSSGFKVQVLGKDEFQIDENSTMQGTIRQNASSGNGPWLVTEGTSSTPATASMSDAQSSEKSSVVLNLKAVVQDHGFVFGKDGFDRNLDKVAALEDDKPTEILNDAMRLDGEILEVTKNMSDTIAGCVHIVPQALCFRNQQTLLMYQSISQSPLKQSQIVIGPVCSKSMESSLSNEVTDIAEEFCRLRFEQVKEASEMRNGNVQDPGTESTLQMVNTAGINMDVLQNAAHVPLHLDLSCSEDSAESRTGAFVVYNTARLATLFSHFEQEVKKGTYPPLPVVSEIDFTLLREEEEWELLYLYIARFPEVLSQAVDTLIPQGGTIAAKVHTHKVTNFLCGLCKCVSSYYSRYHILGGGEGHLLPRMNARLHLMKATHQVLINALDLINVKSPDYL